MTKVKIPKYTLGEEITNAITHGIGAILGIIALILLIIKSSTTTAVIASCIYAFFTILLYVISCIYHALSPNLTGKKVLRVLDHCNVLLMLAGTYTPICLCLLPSPMNWIVFIIVWLITIVSVVFTAINLNKYAWMSIVSNLVLGWGSLFIIKTLIELCTLKGVIILILGGVAYSLGAILYLIGKKKKYIHSVFHVFVLIASIFHLLFIYWYCI